MPDDPHGFRTGSSMIAQEDTQSSDISDDLVSPTTANGSPGGGSAAGSLALGPSDPGTPGAISDMTSTSGLGGGGGVQPTAPAATPERPSFFKGLVTQLALALAQGTKAGVQAPRNAQGPSVAAQTAINEPREQEQIMTRRQMDQANIAMTQLKLHQMVMAAHQMDEDKANEVYNLGRDTYAKLVERKVASPQADGTLKDIQALFAQKQAEYKAAGGKGMLNLHIAPSIDGNMKENNGTGKFSLYKIEDGTTEQETQVTVDYTDLGYTPEDLKAAGLPLKYTVPIPAGTETKTVASKAVQIMHDGLMRGENTMSQWKRKQADIQSKEKEGEANRGSREKISSATLGNRMAIAELNNSTRRAQIALKGADDKIDKELISASKGLVQANKALAAGQGKVGNKAWNELSGKDTREITTLLRARNESQKVFDDLVAKKAAGGSAQQRTKVPKGTPAPMPTILQYLHNAGGDKAKARKALSDDGYVIPPSQKK